VPAQHLNSFNQPTVSEAVGVLAHQALAVNDARPIAGDGPEHRHHFVDMSSIWPATSGPRLDCRTGAGAFNFTPRLASNWFVHGAAKMRLKPSTRTWKMAPALVVGRRSAAVSDTRIPSATSRGGNSAMHSAGGRITALSQRALQSSRRCLDWRNNGDN
jgi:hypothetical protein